MLILTLLDARVLGLSMLQGWEGGANMNKYYELAQFCADDPKNGSHPRLRHFRLKTVMAPLLPSLGDNSTL